MRCCSFLQQATNSLSINLLCSCQTKCVKVGQAVDFCCQYLEMEVGTDNYLYLQELALLYSLERLDIFVDRFVLQHFATLSLTADFLQNVPLHKLTAYLSSEQVGLPPTVSHNTSWP